ncbi:MAG TPA: type II toxin-antitoxin system VapC family toxin [Dehalococcoidia bacterium]|nr:type II toxin-antitoxin system VapC family toxin [Dehalococcoidia bacterium]
MNRTPIVLDASAAIKLVVAERSTDRVRALVDACLHDGREMYAPPHMRGEAVNGIFQRLRSTDPAKHLGRTRVDVAVAQLLRYPISSLDPSGLYERALDFAANHSLPTVYDALYVALAQQLGAELWTADQRLLSALGGAAPWVHDIAGYPMT